jgi:ankyrin repeat protein
MLTCIHCCTVSHNRVSQKASVDAEDNDGLTALMNAAEIGDEDMLQYLLDKGAEPNKLSHSGFTPLILAAAGGHTGCVKALVHMGAEVRTLLYTLLYTVHAMYSLCCLSCV